MLGMRSRDKISKNRTSLKIFFLFKIYLLLAVVGLCCHGRLTVVAVYGLLIGGGFSRCTERL